LFYSLPIIPDFCPVVKDEFRLGKTTAGGGVRGGGPPRRRAQPPGAKYDHSGATGTWVPSALPAGLALRQPAPLFKKLDESVVDEEYARLEG
jgi:hypothetical protein